MEPSAPNTFFPSNLLVVLTMGVLSENCVATLNYVSDEETNSTGKASIPSRANIREDGFTDQASIVSELTPTKSILARLKERAGYNEEYKLAHAARHELGIKRLKMEEESLDLKKVEINARKMEVDSAHLNLLYHDLREDSKESKEDNDMDKVKRIKEDMQKVQQQRLHLARFDN